MSNIKTFVLDTNVLLHSARSLEAFADNRVVIPMTVIEELDKFKNNQDELGRNSRQVVRSLDSLRKKGNLSEGVKLDNGPGGTPCGTVQVVTGEDFSKVPRNMDMHIPDNRIILRAHDTMMRLAVVMRRRRTALAVLRALFQRFDAQDPSVGGLPAAGVFTRFAGMFRTRCAAGIPFGDDPENFAVGHDGLAWFFLRSAVRAFGPGRRFRLWPDSSCIR